MILEIKHKGVICHAIYDDEDHALISSHKWHIDHGYARTSLWEKGKRSSVSMHRLILKHQSPHTHHKNGNKLDNRKENIFPKSVKEHKKEHKGGDNKGRFQPGIKGIKTKLTENQVKEIRLLAKEGVSGREIARRFDMGKTPVGYILNGKTWKHLT